MEDLLLLLWAQRNVGQALTALSPQLHFTTFGSSSTLGLTITVATKAALWTHALSVSSTAPSMLVPCHVR